MQKFVFKNLEIQPPFARRTIKMYELLSLSAQAAHIRQYLDDANREIFKALKKIDNPHYVKCSVCNACFSSEKADH